MVLDVSHTPVARRERQRNVERLRAYSNSLVASVGLPATFSPAGNQQDEWKASERLSQANLDAITFPEIPRTRDGENRTSAAGGGSEDRRARRSLSDGRDSDGRRGRNFSLESGEGRSAEDAEPDSPVTPAPAPHRSSTYSAHPHLSSLRISESSLIGSFEEQPLQTPSGNLQEEFDEVFLHNPPPPPLTPPIQETYIVEDFPPPPPAEMEADHHLFQRFVPKRSCILIHHLNIPHPDRLSSVPRTVNSSNPEITNGSVPIRKSSVQSSLPTKPPSSGAASNVLVFQYQPLPKREKTAEELRVESLARQLVRSSTRPDTNQKG